VSANIGLVSYSNLLECLGKLTKCRLTTKQKIIIEELADNKLNATKLVEHLSNKLYCSKSALWNNLRELREISLVNWNGACQLTEVGKIISQKLSGDGDKENE